MTLPDGQVERFAVSASPQCNDNVPLLDVALVFTPLDDTLSTLTGEGTSGRLIGDRLADPGQPEVALDPSRYTLTTRAGYVYSLDQTFGITQVHTPNGHTLTYSDHGIVHSGGKSVLFTRDTQGRIIAITDPNGQVVMRYRYSATGDLIAATDGEGAESTYRYN